MAILIFSEEWRCFLIIIGKYPLNYRESTITVRLQHHKDLSLELKPREYSHSLGQQSYIKKRQGKGDHRQEENFLYGERLGCINGSGILGHCQ